MMITVSIWRAGEVKVMAANAKHAQKRLAVGSRRVPAEGLDVVNKVTLWKVGGPRLAAHPRMGRVRGRSVNGA